MNGNVTFENIIMVLDELFPQQDDLTPYKVSVVLNEILKANGKKEIRSQMMYNYARNGMLVKGTKIAGESLRPITKTETATFIVRYMSKHDLVLPGTMTESPDQLVLDLEI